MMMSMEIKCGISRLKMAFEMELFFFFCCSFYNKIHICMEVRRTIETYMHVLPPYTSIAHKGIKFIRFFHTHAHTRTHTKHSRYVVLLFFPAYMLNIFYESHILVFFSLADLMPLSKELDRPFSDGSQWNHCNQPHRWAKHITSIHPLNIKVNITYIRFSAFQTNLFFPLFEMPVNMRQIKKNPIYSIDSFSKRQSNSTKNTLWKGVASTIEFYPVK